MGSFFKARKPRLETQKRKLSAHQKHIRFITVMSVLILVAVTVAVLLLLNRRTGFTP